MIRHIGLMLLLSFALLFSMPYLQWLAAKLYQFELLFIYETRFMFPGGAIGHIIRQVITLTLTPIIFAGIAGGVYWIFTRRTLPYIEFITWALWLMLILVLACHK